MWSALGRPNVVMLISQKAHLKGALVEVAARQSSQLLCVKLAATSKPVMWAKEA
ncbi:MAG: hypothetical protein AAGJ73_03790 [Pseudomonadota bacterium]